MGIQNVAFTFFIRSIYDINKSSLQKFAPLPARVVFVCAISLLFAQKSLKKNLHYFSSKTWELKMVTLNILN
jgi:hypothetical protein